MNASNYTQEDVACLGESDLVRTVKLMAIALVAGFGIFGNVLVIVIAVKYTNQRNINFLIVNMAVSDTLIIILYTFLSVPTLVNKNAWRMIPNFTIATHLCKALRFVDVTSKTVTLLTLVIISIDRYRATRVTALRLRPYTKRRKVAVVTCLWTLSMASCSVVAITAGINPQKGIYICQSSTVDAVKDKVLAAMFITFTLSLFSVILLSTLTTLRLRRPAVVHSNLSDAQRQIRAKRITNAVRMVVCSILLYAFCYSSSLFWVTFFFIISNDAGFSYAAFGLSCKSWMLFSFMTEFLVTVNSSLSPYVYILFLPEFREATKSLFCKQSSAQRAGLELTAVVENQGTNRRNNRSSEQAREQNS